MYIIHHNTCHVEHQDILRVEWQNVCDIKCQMECRIACQDTCRGGDQMKLKKQLRSLRSRFLLMQDEIHLEAGDALELPLHLSMPSFDKLMKENEDRG